VAKLNKASPPGSKVLAGNTLHFKPIFHQFLKKNVKEAPVSDEGCVSKAWLFSSACENLGAQHSLGAKIWPSEKFYLGGYILAAQSLVLVNQSSPNFFYSTQN